MASARNNRIQERRAALREQQRMEREAADIAFKALDSEYDARMTAARSVAALIDLCGRERAAALLDLEPKDIAAYVRFAGETEDQDDGVPTVEPAQSQGSVEGIPAEIPAQTPPAINTPA